MGLEIAVVYGSVRSARQGIKAARFVQRQLEERGHQTTLVDPLERRLPLLDKRYSDYEEGRAPEVLEELAALYRKADAFVFVTGEYNHSIPPALKNLIDHFMNEYFWRPAGIVSYSGGSFGGVRAALQLRAILSEVGLITLPSIFAVPKVGSSFDDDGRPQDEGPGRRSKKFLDELEWYANALKLGREGGVPYS
ncbi:MAG: NADPH-dependent FMN reductase [Candidatus Eisenbacteria bacterium]|nr:NADPH-dependent FMN reductase [Candidatus Eisenbacteria bacterium]